MAQVRKDSGNAKWAKLQGVLSVVVPVDQKATPRDRGDFGVCGECVSYSGDGFS